MTEHRPRSLRVALVVALAASLLTTAATPGVAAIQYSETFESGNLSAWSRVVSFTASNVSGGAFAGSWFGQASSTGASSFAQDALPNPLTNLYLQSAVRVQSAANGVPTIYRFLTSGGTAILSLKTKATGALLLKNHVTGASRTASTVLPSGSYQLLQVHAQINGASSLVEVWLNGIQVSGLTWTTNLGTSPVGMIQLAHKGSSSGFQVAYDNVVVDTVFIGGGSAPATPTGLAATSVTANSATLTWNAVTGADGYGVYRGGVLVQNVTGTSFTNTGLSPSTTYHYTVDAFDGTLRSARSAPPVAVATRPVGGTVVRAAADIACDPADNNFNGGAGTTRHCRQKYTADLLAGADAVFAIGDTQYGCAGTLAFAQSYHPTWGRFQEITYAEPADAEYDTVGTDCGAAGADGFYSYFGTRGGAPGTTLIEGVFSFNLPSGCTSGTAGCWHVVVLNSVCRAIGGCGEGSAVDNWLEQDLAANAAAGCSLALLHIPRFASRSSGANQINDAVRDLWDSMYAGGVDVVLSGNTHIYERFAPQDVAGNADPGGIVQWIVGTGGKSLGDIAAVRLANSVTGQSTSFGVLDLALRSGAYDWRFLTEVGSPAFTDTGTSSCTNV